MYDIEFINALWESNPKLMVLFISTLSTLIMMIVKHNYTKWKENREVIESSKVFICSFARILVSSIINNDKELAKDHYKILLNSFTIFKKDKNLYSKYKILHSYYISLQINNFIDQTKKEKAIIAIENLIKDTDKGC